jgi:hypothetical protein
MRHIVIFLTLLAMVGCSAVDVRQYAENTPKLSLAEYFSGNTRGWGMVQDRKGRLIRQFVVDITGVIDQQGNLVLDEFFVWNDGEQSSRTWTIRPIDENAFTGTAADVVGEAAGESYGNALHWRYSLEVPVDGKSWQIFFDDWMFLQPDEVLINRTEMRKFGLRVGEVTIVFRKEHHRED